MSLQVNLHDKQSGQVYTQTVHLPRSTGLRTSFADIKSVLAVKARVVEDRIADATVDGMIVSMKSTPEQYGVSDGETIDFTIRVPSHDKVYKATPGRSEDY